MTFQAPEALRQSTIARFDNCPLSLLLGEIAPERRQPSNLAATGTLFHRWVARVIRIMRQTGEIRFGVDQGMDILQEIIAQRDIPDEDVVHVPMGELKWLRIICTRWCEGGDFNAARVIAVEEELSGVIKVPDGHGGFYDRIVTGHPDCIVADPPDGVIVPDWKTGWTPPAKLGYEDQQMRNQASVTREEKLTDQGYAQQVIYGVLILQNLPAINRVTLREVYLRHGEYREATVDRYNLERLTDILGGVIAQIDAAFEAGPESKRWFPTAGPHCGICPAPRHCPLKEWEGIPDTLDEAQLLAREWIVAGQVRKERLPLLKGWVEANGPIPIEAGKGRREVGWPEWDGQSTNHGTFKLYEPEDSPVSQFDERLAELMRQRTAA